MTKTLLDKAHAADFGKRRRNNITKDEVELALAWARGLVGLKQVSAAYGHKHAESSYQRLAQALREHIQQTV